MLPRGPNAALIQQDFAQVPCASGVALPHLASALLTKAQAEPHLQRVHLRHGPRRCLGRAVPGTDARAARHGTARQCQGRAVYVLALGAVKGLPVECTGCTNMSKCNCESDNS